MVQPNDRLHALKNAIDASPITPLHDYRKITFKRNGKILRGHFWNRNGIVTVKSSDGGQKSTHIGGSPPRALARLMLVEIEEARLGKPMFAEVVHAQEPPHA
jgi:hypothetical protein